MSDSESTSDAAASEPLLTPIEARVLGCLMEKQLTTPDAYPLTLNSLVTACNQKTSREPVMSLHSGEVQRCLNGLREKALIQVDNGSRADRYYQRLTRKLCCDQAAQAIFTLMLLRGAQTMNELYSRSQRLFAFDGNADVEQVVEQLLEQDQCWLVKLPRQAGQREDRYMHLLCGTPDVSVQPLPAANAQSSISDDLRDRVEQLEEQVAWLLDKLGRDVQANTNGPVK